MDANVVQVSYPQRSFVARCSLTKPCPTSSNSGLQTLEPQYAGAHPRWQPGPRSSFLAHHTDVGTFISVRFELDVSPLRGFYSNRGRDSVSSTSTAHPPTHNMVKIAPLPCHKQPSTYSELRSTARLCGYWEEIYSSERKSGEY